MQVNAAGLGKESSTHVGPGLSRHPYSIVCKLAEEASASIRGSSSLTPDLQLESQGGGQEGLCPVWREDEIA